jgi:hypothetical protein
MGIICLKLIKLAKSADNFLYTRFPWKAEYAFSQKTLKRGKRLTFLRMSFSGFEETQV